MKILGWYSFLLISSAIAHIIIDEKNNVTEWLLGVLLLLPILIYIRWTLPLL